MKTYILLTILILLGPGQFLCFSSRAQDKTFFGPSVSLQLPSGAVRYVDEVERQKIIDLLNERIADMMMGHNFRMGNIKFRFYHYNDVNFIVLERMKYSGEHMCRVTVAGQKAYRPNYTITWDKDNKVMTDSGGSAESYSQSFSIYNMKNNVYLSCSMSCSATEKPLALKMMQELFDSVEFP